MEQLPLRLTVPIRLSSKPNLDKVLVSSINTLLKCDDEVFADDDSLAGEIHRCILNHITGELKMENWHVKDIAVANSLLLITLTRDVVEDTFIPLPDVEVLKIKEAFKRQEF